MAEEYERLKGESYHLIQGAVDVIASPSHPPDSQRETARVARAVLPLGSLYLQMRDTLGTLYQDDDFLDLFPTRGQPAEAPWRRALVTILHYAEGLTDRQAADAVRTRIAWKYTLSLELTSPGFDFSVLSEFRSRLLAHGAERRLFDLLLEQFRARLAKPLVADNAPILLICWRPFARFGAWNVWAKRCDRRSMCWQKWLQIGS